MVVVGFFCSHAEFEVGHEKKDKHVFALFVWGEPYSHKTADVIGFIVVVKVETFVPVFMWSFGMKGIGIH